VKFVFTLDTFEAIQLVELSFVLDFKKIFELLYATQFLYRDVDYCLVLCY